MVMTLMCLVNSYHGLLMYEIRTTGIHLSYHPYCVALVSSLESPKGDSFLG